MRNIVLFLLICLPLTACQSHFGVRGADQFSPEKDTSPGKKLVVVDSKVWVLESCKSRELPYLRLDQTEVVPKTIKPGTSMRYRLSYTACLPHQTPSIPGRLETRISFKGELQNVRSDDGYRVETGKWIVDTHIAVPKDTKPGTYILDASLSTKGRKLQDHVSFNVEH